MIPPTCLAPLINLAMGVSSGRERAPWSSNPMNTPLPGELRSLVKWWARAAVGGALGITSSNVPSPMLSVPLGAAEFGQGHIHAHGLGTVEGDHQEAAAIADVFGSWTTATSTTAKGTLQSWAGGGGDGCSVLSLGGELFPIRNLKILTINVRLTLAVDQVFRPEIHSSLRTTRKVRRPRFASSELPENDHLIDFDEDPSFVMDPRCIHLKIAAFVL